MCRNCDDPGAAVDVDLLREMVDEHEVAVFVTDDGRAPTAYTVGYADVGHPELLVVGLPPEESAVIVAAVIKSLAEHMPILHPGVQFDLDDDTYHLEVVAVDYPGIHLPHALTLYGRVHAIQLVWTTDTRCWPWDPGWQDGGRRQPVYGLRSPRKKLIFASDLV